ncbi:MAG: hypothetical protein ACPGJU_04535 [Coraliomargarita sp.]
MIQPRFSKLAIADLTTLLLCALFLRPMHKQQPASSLFTRITSGCLAVLILLLGIATVSPQMHEALHAGDDQHQCSGHHHHDHPEPPADDCESAPTCAVSFFDNGATSVMPLVELPARTDLIIAVVSQSAKIVWCGQSLIRRCSRAPPIENVV